MAGFARLRRIGRRASRMKTAAALVLSLILPSHPVDA
jgi:hypothetical protein